MLLTERDKSSSPADLGLAFWLAHGNSRALRGASLAPAQLSVVVHSLHRARVCLGPRSACTSVLQLSLLLLLSLSFIIKLGATLQLAGDSAATRFAHALATVQVVVFFLLVRAAPKRAPFHGPARLWPVEFPQNSAATNNCRLLATSEVATN